MKFLVAAAAAAGSVAGQAIADVDSLRMDQTQMLGSHNSYHLTPERPVPEWRFSMAEFDTQLSGGVRQVELDLQPDSNDDAAYDVQHIKIFDAKSHCETLDECLTDLHTWSAANPTHSPIFVWLETKDSLSVAQFNAIDAKIRAMYTAEQMFTPDDMMAYGVAEGEEAHASLVDSLTANGGWPTVGDMRGRTVFCLNNGYDNYMQGEFATLSGRVAFPVYSHSPFVRHSTQALTQVLVSGTKQDESELVTAIEQARAFDPPQLVRARADAVFVPGLLESEIKAGYFDMLDSNGDSYISLSEAQTFFDATSITEDVSNLAVLIEACGGDSDLGAEIGNFGCINSIVGQAASPLYPDIDEFETTAMAKRRRDVVLHAGAHFASTDFPLEVAETDYVVSLRTVNGQVACNPVSVSSTDCPAAAIGVGYSPPGEYVDDEADNRADGASRAALASVLATVVAVGAVLIL